MLRPTLQDPGEILTRGRRRMSHRRGFAPNTPYGLTGGCKANTKWPSLPANRETPTGTRTRAYDVRVGANAAKLGRAPGAYGSPGPRGAFRSLPQKRAVHEPQRGGAAN